MKEPSPLFDPDFDPYDRLIELEILLTQLAHNQENLAEHVRDITWKIAEITNGCSRMAEAITNLHNRLTELELQNEKG